MFYCILEPSIKTNKDDIEDFSIYRTRMIRSPESFSTPKISSSVTKTFLIFHRADSPQLVRVRQSKSLQYPTHVSTPEPKFPSYQPHARKPYIPNPIPNPIPTPQSCPSLYLTYTSHPTPTDSPPSASSHPPHPSAHSSPTDYSPSGSSSLPRPPRRAPHCRAPACCRPSCAWFWPHRC